MFPRYIVFFVLTNWRPVTFYSTSNNMLDGIGSNNCDKWIIFGDTLSKGKKNYHVFHNACLTYLIDSYDKERQNNDKLPIQNNTITLIIFPLIMDTARTFTTWTHMDQSIHGSFTSLLNSFVSRGLGM